MRAVVVVAEVVVAVAVVVVMVAETAAVVVAVALLVGASAGAVQGIAQIPLRGVLVLVLVSNEKAVLQVPLPIPDTLWKTPVHVALLSH